MAEGGLYTGYDLGFLPTTVIGKYIAVVQNATGVEVVDAEGDLWVGVAQFAISAAEITKKKVCSVRMSGVSLVVVGTGGVTLNTIVATDGAGKAVASNTGARPLGIALATKAVGEYVPVLLTPGLPLLP